jgi:hypothetical protein
MASSQVFREIPAVGEQVWLPVTEVRKVHTDFQPGHGGAMIGGKIVGITGRSRLVDVNGLGESNPILVSSRRLRHHAKVLLLRIGDWQTEQTSLNPLADSLKSQLSLLLPPGEVDVEYIRTLAELSSALQLHGNTGAAKLQRQASPWGYVVLVGHGRINDPQGMVNPGIKFGSEWHSPTEIADAMKTLGPGRRGGFGNAVFVSLCCETGEPDFAKPFSDALNTTWVGPGDVVHSFEAAGLVQRLFFEHFLSGRDWRVAFKHTRAATKEFSTTIRCWTDGTEATR